MSKAMNNHFLPDWISLMARWLEVILPPSYKSMVTQAEAKVTGAWLILLDRVLMIAFDSSDKSNRAFPQGYDHSHMLSHGASCLEVITISLGTGMWTETKRQEEGTATWTTKDKHEDSNMDRDKDREDVINNNRDVDIGEGRRQRQGQGQR